MRWPDGLHNRKKARPIKHSLMIPSDCGAMRQRNFQHNRRRSFEPLDEPSSGITIVDIVKVILGGITIGVVGVIGLHFHEKAEERNAVLAALPAGFHFAGCDEVRARGLDPLFRNEPGFSDRMDGDGDGIACEPYR